MPEHPLTSRFLYWHAVRHKARIWMWRVAAVAITLILTLVCISLARTPSNDRDWAPDHAITPAVEFTSVGTVPLYEVSGIRTTDYSKDDPKPTYYTDRFLSSEVRDLWFVVVPFAGVGAAHTFLSFGMDDGRYVSISVEARREVGEEYSPWLGLLDQYELMYVVADERDVIGRRVKVDGDPVYLYPTVATREQAQAVFEDVMRRVATLAPHPESYDTIVNNCTTNLADHINSALGDGTIPWSWTLIAPKDSDSYALSLGILDVESPSIERERERHLANEAAFRLLDRSDFSEELREEMGLIEKVD